MLFACVSNFKLITSQEEEKEKEEEANVEFPCLKW